MSWHIAQEKWAQPAICITSIAHQLLEDTAPGQLAQDKSATGSSENLILFVLWQVTSQTHVAAGSFNSEG